MAVEGAVERAEELQGVSSSSPCHLCNEVVREGSRNSQCMLPHLVTPEKLLVRSSTGVRGGSTRPNHLLTRG